MGNTYDSMAGAVSSGKDLGQVAFISSMIASTLAFWELWTPMPSEKSGILLNALGTMGGGGGKMAGIWGKAAPVKLPGVGAAKVALGMPPRLALIRTDTATMMDACSKVHEAAKVASQLSADVVKHGSTITEQTWKAKDQEQFGEQLDMYRISLDATKQLGYVTASLTAVVAMLRFIQLAIAAALMTVLAALAVAWVAAMAMSWAFGIGAGVAATIRSIGTPLVRISQKIVPVMEAVMVMVGLGHVAICTLMTANAAAVDSYKIGDIGGGGWDSLQDTGLRAVEDLLEKYKRKGLKAIPDFSGF
ncbi:hypothetical protein [Actinopolymorpha rutila]|uniref:Uncharacterized protein n=1 Tax=Actinopolymorpha rutila TaxID=446787 RepID=A0A852Z660_9ACTN|nr:hypothetical protein [Actinopolymorpha rutila]NYH87705.1 hypothetical protein [Actinopolymorpha rutila]